MWSSWNDLWHWCCLEADQIVEEFWTLSNYGHSKAKSYYHRSNMTSEVFWLFLSSLAFQRLKGNFFQGIYTKDDECWLNWYLLAFWQYLAINHDFHYRFIFFLFWDSVFFHKSSSVQIKKKSDCTFWYMLTCTSFLQNFQNKNLWYSIFFFIKVSSRHFSSPI